VFWIWGAATEMGHRTTGFGWSPDSFFPLFGVPFVLIGLAMLSAPFWAYRKSSRTVYAITNKRVAIIESGKTRTVQSYSGEDLGTIKRIERADGSGDLTFAKKHYTDSEGRNRSSDISFIGIPQVRAVETILREAFKDD
jgi:hypothetical protein